MKRNCCIPFCKSRRKKSGIIHHEFPSKLPIRVQWLLVIPMQNFQPVDSSVVCSEHFTADDYFPPTQRCRYKRLKPYAVPSIFPDECIGSKRNKVETTRHEPAKLAKPIKTYVSKKNNSNTISSNITVMVVEPDIPNQMDETVNPNFIASPTDNKQTAEKSTEKLAKTSNVSVAPLQNESRETIGKHTSLEIPSLSLILKDASAKKLGAQFLLELISNYGNPQPSWTELFINECAMLQIISPEGYTHFRDRLLMLPDKNTLVKHLSQKRHQK